MAFPGRYPAAPDPLAVRYPLLVFQAQCALCAPVYICDADRCDRRDQRGCDCNKYCLVTAAVFDIILTVSHEALLFTINIDRCFPPSPCGRKSLFLILGRPLTNIIAENRAGDNAQALTVSEISASLKRAVEDQFGYVRVKGELSGFKRAASGHLYFGLKDENAMLDGVMWKGNAARLPFAPEDGLEVVLTGKLTTYPGRSKYQIVADQMELAGEGALAVLFEKLKARLAAEGLFDPQHKRKIPAMPSVIGVVTSPTGAVIRDILHRLGDRFPSHVIIWPVLVQGENAAGQIAAAVKGFSDLQEGGPVPRPDVLIVARGGGSIEDLWAFNEEAVVRAVAHCSIPLISAVGHETDTTLCDFAADLRAPTPTAAAEMAVPVRADLLDRVGQNALRLDRAVRRNWTQSSERLEAQRRLLPKLTELTAPQQQRSDELGERLGRGLERRLSGAAIAFTPLSRALGPRLLERTLEMKQKAFGAMRLSGALLESRLVHGQQRLIAAHRLLESLHPEAPLKRGFARVTDSTGKTVMTRDAARAAGHFTLRFIDGDIGAMVNEAGEAVKPASKPLAEKPASPKSPKNTASGDQADLFG
ncbi:MAG: exodeoxyribonuclease VII large subunit [Sphingomonadales bacterium]|nr:exodeoxyribonuclease VII large subunit [Sphingomonadales bacterium]